MTIAIMEFLGLLLYECLVAFLMGAFHEMKPQRKNIYLIFALLPLVLMTMFHGETVGNDTGEYVNFLGRCEYEDYAQILEGSRFEKGYVTFVSVCAYLEAFFTSAKIFSPIWCCSRRCRNFSRVVESGTCSSLKSMRMKDRMA